MAEIGIRGEFCEKLSYIHWVQLVFRSSYSELTSLYISTPYTCQVWIQNSIDDMKIADDIFKCIFNESVWISITISLKFVPKGPIDCKSALVQVMD